MTIWLQSTTSLEEEVEEAARKAHVLIESGVTPKPVYDKKCERCSLVNQCLPKASGKKASVENYLAQARRES